jgi:predicted transcriptional regulator YdeE
MQPRFRRHESMFAAGYSVRTSNADEMVPGRMRIPALWQHFFAEGALAALENCVKGAPPLGIYMDYENGAEGEYSVIAGVEVQDLSNIPEPLCGVSIEEGDYLVFTGEGPMPEAVIAAWRHVWEFFARPRCDALRRRFTVDFERYVGEDAVEIWIGVEAGG